jgi:hypothetical protein
MRSNASTQFLAPVQELASNVMYYTRINAYCMKRVVNITLTYIQIELNRRAEHSRVGILLQAVALTATYAGQVQALPAGSVSGKRPKKG